MKTVALILLLTSTVWGHAEPTANLKDGVLLKGYDPISYFKAGGPLKGDPSIKTQVGDVTYFFANPANKSEFEKSPTKYTPAYEGWCATAVVKGKKVDIDPLNYKITDGRLFLFYRESGIFGGDAKPQWVKDEAENIKKADANWPKVRESKE